LPAFARFLARTVWKLLLTVLLLSGFLGYVGVSWLRQETLSTDKQPYVHWSGLDPHHEVYVTWESGREVPSFICYGTDPARLDQVLRDDKPVTLHRFHLRGLLPGTRYYYRAGTPPDIDLNGLPGTRTFTTAPEQPVTFSVACVSDTQQIFGIGYYNTVASTLARVPNLAFLINAGDLTQEAENQHLWNLFFHESVFLDRYPLVPCPGNHDNIEAANPLYFKYFGTTVSERDAYYAFDWGDVRFIIAQIANVSHVDPGDPKNQPMYRWLEATLAASGDRMYRVLVYHRDVSDIVAPLVEKYNVSLSLHGHEHSYARYEINGHTYVCLGNGATVQNPLVRAKPGVRKVTNHAGFTKLTFSPEGIRLRTFTPWLDVMDEVFLRRDAATGSVSPEELAAGDRET